MTVSVASTFAGMVTSESSQIRCEDMPGARREPFDLVAERPESDRDGTNQAGGDEDRYLLRPVTREPRPRDLGNRGLELNPVTRRAQRREPDGSLAVVMPEQRNGIREAGAEGLEDVADPVGRRGRRDAANQAPRGVDGLDDERRMREIEHGRRVSPAGEVGERFPRESSSGI